MFIFVVKPLGTCRGWGSSRSVALLSSPPEAHCVATGCPHPVAPHSAGAEGGPLEGTGRQQNKQSSWVLQSANVLSVYSTRASSYTQSKLAKTGKWRWTSGRNLDYGHTGLWFVSG
ncbi:unnamed protein product [Pleuronectes platessa]|uniref:Uncharacterized protein n=1 Tax=Pleuronectes platessa TaxID=8262 RepID=A0A9N7U1G6_PLEPL|nr:unnamed protein product [Pleuronectes platessa]